MLGHLTNLSTNCDIIQYLLFKLRQYIGQHGSVFNVLFYCATQLEKAENIVLLCYAQTLAKFLNNLENKTKKVVYINGK